MMVRREVAGVRLLTRNGYNWTGRFPLIAAAAEALRARSFLIDGEAVACDGDGLPVFDRLRYRRARMGGCFCMPSTCSSSTAGTCGANRSSGARCC
jgi:bifunctional non-homologous end joining protein LigD